MKIYCEVCGEDTVPQELVFAKSHIEGRSWADIVCSVCDFVISTVVIDGNHEGERYVLKLKKEDE